MTTWGAPLIMLLACLFIGLACGIPMVFTMGVGSLLTGAVFYGPSILQLSMTSTFGVMSSATMVAVPMFIFMAIILEKSGIADALFDALHQWLGWIPGGLAMSVIIISALLGAMSGVAAAGTVTMGLIALPVMLEKKYNKSLAIGPILVGGPLGILIPPSIGFIIYGMLTNTSIGKLFAAGLIPGIMLSGMYVIYIFIVCKRNPEAGPVIPPEERLPFLEKVKLAKGLILPILIVLGVLGSIFFGIASPTEAAAIGALGSAISAVIYKKFSWKIVKEATIRTLITTGMVAWILFGANIFSSVLVSTGVPNLIRNFIAGLDVSSTVIVLFMMATYLIMGCFLEETTMLMITIPIYMPILQSYGLDPIWFGVLFMISMQTAFITPPFGFSLFFLKSIAPSNISTLDIYKSVPPFIVIQIIAIIICMIFPQIVTWLPSIMSLS